MLRRHGVVGVLSLFLGACGGGSGNDDGGEDTSADGSTGTTTDNSSTSAPSTSASGSSAETSADGSESGGSSGEESGETGSENCPPAPAMIDGIVLPSPEGVSWVEGVDNPFFPLPVGATWHFEADTPEGLEEDDVEVLAEVRDVNGVTATVVYDVVSVDGEIAEETWDWYAQDSEGNVWYLGEETCEFKNGKCFKHAGEWEWGVDCALPGIIMPGDPQADGQPFFQEYYEGEAEDVGEVLALDESIDVTAGSFDGCIRTADTSHLDAALQEEKVYCPGVGNVFVAEDEFDVHLTEYSIP